MPFATINGARLWYDVIGAGEPILMHHGYTACRVNWQSVADQLSNRYQIILMECRGAGESEDTSSGYTLEQLADDAVGLLDYLELPVATFAGHSMGGGVAYVMATRHAERLSRLILMAPIPSGGIGPLDPKVVEAVQDARRNKRRDFFMAQEIAARFRDDVQTQAWAEHRVDQILRVSEGHATELAQAMSSLRLEAAIESMHIPTLMVCGSADGLLLPNLADFQRLPNAGLHVLSRAGHDVGVHEPQAVATAIDDFMKFGPVSARLLIQRGST